MTEAILGFLAVFALAFLRIPWPCPCPSPALWDWG